MNSVSCNTFSYGAHEARRRFAEYLDDCPEDPSAIVCVISEGVLDAPARKALDASFERLGFGAAPCTYINLIAKDKALPEEDLYFLLESLDPLALVAADTASQEALARVYKTALTAEKATNLLGRPTLCFRDFSALLATPQLKQQAWAALKQLKRA